MHTFVNFSDSTFNYTEGVQVNYYTGVNTAGFHRYPRSGPGNQGPAPGCTSSKTTATYIIHPTHPTGASGTIIEINDSDSEVPDEVEEAVEEVEKAAEGVEKAARNAAQVALKEQLNSLNEMFRSIGSIFYHIGR